MKYLLLNRCARCRYNYKYGNFTLSFGRLSQKIPLECLVDVQHGYFPSLNKSDEFIDEDKRARKRRGKTRAWIRSRSSKGCYNNIGKELMIEDTGVYKGMMRMNHGSFWIRWALRVHGLNMLSVAEQMYSTLLSHTWMITKQRKC